jgi:hypothetical protein
MWLGVVLEGKQIVVIDRADWRGKDARRIGMGSGS